MDTSALNYAPGHGPMAKVSVSLHTGNIRAIKDRVGARRFSAYVDNAIERQIERDLLQEAIDVNLMDCGPIPQELRDEATDLFHEVRLAPELQEEGEWLAYKAS